MRREGGEADGERMRARDGRGCNSAKVFRRMRRRGRGTNSLGCLLCRTSTNIPNEAPYACMYAL